MRFQKCGNIPGSISTIFFLSLLYARLSSISLLCDKLFPLSFLVKVCPMMWSNFLLLASSPEMISFQFLWMCFFVLMQCYVLHPRWSPPVNRKSPSCKHTETFHFRLPPYSWGTNPGSWDVIINYIGRRWNVQYSTYRGTWRKYMEGVGSWKSSSEIKDPAETPNYCD